MVQSGRPVQRPGRRQSRAGHSLAAAGLLLLLVTLHDGLVVLQQGKDS